MTWVALANCEVDPDQGRVRLGGEVRRLGITSTQVLSVLLRAAPDPVTYRALRTEVDGWTYLTADNTLQRAVRRLKEALRDPPSVAPLAEGEHRHIESVTGLGYRFLPLVPPAPAASVLELAHQAADRHGGRYVGLEHILEVVRLAPEHSEALDALRVLLGGWRCLPPADLGLKVRLDNSAGTEPSPRLRQLDLPEDADGVARVLLAAHRPLVGCLAERPTLPEFTGSAASRARPRQRTPTPSARLEIVGGPEDGRVLALEDGDTIGRSTTTLSQSHALYEGTWLSDPGLRRSHGRWTKADGLACVREWRLSRAGRVRKVEAELSERLEVGDQLWLSAATRLMAV